MCHRSQCFEFSFSSGAEEGHGETFACTISTAQLIGQDWNGICRGSKMSVMSANVIPSSVTKNVPVHHFYSPVINPRIQLERTGRGQ